MESAPPEACLFRKLTKNDHKGRLVRSWTVCFFPLCKHASNCKTGDKYNFLLKANPLLIYQLLTKVIWWHKSLYLLGNAFLAQSSESVKTDVFQFSIFVNMYLPNVLYTLALGFVKVFEPLQTYKLWSKSQGFVRNLLGALDLELHWSFRPINIP